jgi:hypothetical protein
MSSNGPVLLTVCTLLVPLAGCAVIAFAFACGASALFRQPFLTVLSYYVCFSIPVGLIAYVAGDATGISRSPAVANVVPAVLALIAGMNVYAFGTDNKYKVVVGYCVSVFAVMFFLGLQVGASARQNDLEESLLQLSRIELRVRAERKRLGLPDDVPGWLSEAESKN